MSNFTRKWPALGLFAALACATAQGPAPSSVRAPPPSSAVAPTPLASLALAKPPPPPALRLPGTARPLGYAVDLTVVPSAVTFNGVVDLDMQVTETTSVFWLNASELKIKGATLTVEGQEGALTVVPGGEQFVGFVAKAKVGPGPAHLRISYEGMLNDKDTHGLFHQQVQGTFYTYSQFEPLDARKAFPCFDEPSFKVPWQLTLHVPKETLAFSNTKVEAEKDEAAGMKAVRFSRTPPLPSYLVALAVGPFDVVDAGKAGVQQVPLRIVMPKGLGSDVGYTARIAGPLLERLEKYFDLPYPYEKLDLVGIPLTVGFGAMENPGMVTFNQQVLAWKQSERTEDREREDAVTIAHEFAHQWFGDLVTMAWWDDLWLNESFATWMEFNLLKDWEPGWEMALSRANTRAQAMGADSLVSARLIRQPIETEGDIVNAFDGITYSKGMSILTMFERYLGPEVFRRAVTRHLKTHAFGTATAEDFLKAISAEAGKDMAPAFSRFLDQPGVPWVSLSLVCEKGQPARLRLSQQRYLPTGSTGNTAQTWQVPVCVRYGKDTGEGQVCTLLEKPEGSLELPGATCPPWVVPNADGAGYFRSLPSKPLLTQLLGDGGKRLSDEEKVSLLSDLGALSYGGKLSVAEALSLVPGVVATHPKRHVLRSTMTIIEGVKNHLVPQAQRPIYSQFVRDLYGDRAHALGFSSRPGESRDDKELRPRLIEMVAQEGEDAQLIAEARTLTEKWLVDRRAVQPEMVDTVLGVAARNSDAKLYDKLLTAAKQSQTIEDRAHFLEALSQVRSFPLIQANLDVLTSGTFDIREAMPLIRSPTRNHDTREQGYELFKARYDKVSAMIPREMVPFLSYAGVNFCDAAHREDVASFFKERSAKAPGGERTLRQVLESIDLCIAQKARESAGVSAFLDAYAKQPRPLQFPHPR